MRRRLALLSMATTTLVVISLLVPLGLLVRRQAMDRARAQAERDAQTIASLIGLAITIDPSLDAVADAVGPLDIGQIVVLSDGDMLGTPHPGQGSLAQDALESRATITMLVATGWEVALPVVGRDSSAVVDVFVTDAELTNGVSDAWLLLGILGLVLVAAAVWVADRLGARLVKPISDLAMAARRMGDGDLEARVEPSRPEEIREVGVAFNQLAERLDQFLVAERESVADLSHRLRTPLTSLRLQAEKITDVGDRSQVLTQVDRIEQSVNQMIVTARSGPNPGIERCVLDSMVLDRGAFWSVLAEEQGRVMSVETGAPNVELGISRESVEALIDTLVGNVFDHTPPGTAFELTTGETDHRPWLEVADHGPGFPNEPVLQRGMSGRGSTGLGLDIARSTAEMTGGSLEVMNSVNGPTRVRVWFG